MSAGRDNPNIPGNRSLFRSARVPYSPERQNLAGTAAAGDSNPITSPALFSAYSTSALNAVHETSAPQAAPSCSMSRAAEQHAGPSIPPSWSIPSGSTQVPINILVFHRRLTGRGSRPQIPLFDSCTPAPALPGVSEDGASIQLAGNNFLSLGRASNIVASHAKMSALQSATPDTCSSERALRPNFADDEASKTGNETDATQQQQSATTNYCDSDATLKSVVSLENTLEVQVQHSQESTVPAAEGSADDMHMYQPMQKRSKTQIRQSEHTPSYTPAVLKQITLTQIEMQISGAKKHETFRNEETPAQKLKTRRKRHRPKVIREDRKAKVQKSVDSMPDGKSPQLKVKRSYVRKKGNVSSLEKSSGPVSDQSISGGIGIAGRRTASVRRTLQFGLKEQRVRGDDTLTGDSHHHNIEKLVHAESSFGSVTESEVQVRHGLQADMENSLGGLAFGMSPKLNKLLDECIHLPDVTPKPTQEVSIANPGSLGKELARGQDNIGRTHETDATSKNWLCIEKKVGMTVAERSKRDLELNHSVSDDFPCSGRSLPDMESTRSHTNKVSTVENHIHHNNDESSLTGIRDSIILRTAAEMLAFCRPGGIKKKRSSRTRRNAFVSIMDLQNNTSQASTGLSQQCMDALYESCYIKFITKKRSQKVRPQCSSTVEPNLELKTRLPAGRIFYGEYNGPKISERTFHKSSPWTLDNQRVNLDIHCRAPEGSSTSTSTVPYIDYLQEVSSKLQHLDLNSEQVHRTDMNLSLTMPAVISFGGIYDLSNAMVPYGGGMVVPYERPLQIVKRQRPRAKVDLDFETTRAWNFLMGNNVEPVDGTDLEERWQQEREVFQGRANLFIARMRLVQGDRRFSPWKGSVVDSVVGVFLTQNVADHLSSSAYMALAATFPSRSVNSSCKDNTATQDNGQTIGTSHLAGQSTFDLFYSGARPNLAVNCDELSVNYKNIRMETKDNTSANDSIKGKKYYFEYKTATASVFNHQGTGMEYKAHQLSDFSSVELTASTEVLQQMQVQSEISSSQSVTLETRQPRLLFSSGVPRNFVVDGSVAAYQQQGKKFDHGKSLTGNGTITSETECQRLKTVTINGDGVGKSETSDSILPFCSTIDTQQLYSRNEQNVSSTSPNSSSGSASPYLKGSKDEKANPLFAPYDSHVAERSGNKTVTAVFNSPNTSTKLAVDHDKQTSFEAPDMQENELRFVMDEMIAEPTRKDDECTLKSGFTSYNEVPDTESPPSRPKKTKTSSKKNTENVDWDKLRRQVCREGNVKERSFERRDSVDWEAVRCADVQRISHAIRERGMNNVLAERIQNFLNRLVRDHGSIDLEWLRDIPPDSAKDFLLSIRGLGLKSVECVRLLTLHHLAFPVDTNVGRICVRLGWVPIQPLPESLQLHLLELYPILETIQKYLWPRLCKLDQQTLYELHYHMITFGKVFCTKSKPNCNACPLRSECKHFASAFASARLALPASQEKSLVKSSNQFAFGSSSMPSRNSSHLPHLEGSIHARDFIPKNPDPIIEEPASPREECPETMENDIEDFDEDGEIPTIKLNMEAFAQNLENCIKESNKELQSDDIAKALVAISNEAASIPLPKLKNVHRLRTEHYVYELPDLHPLVLQLELDQRELDDPSPYLLAIWTPDEINEISNTPKSCYNSQVEGELCNNEMCHNCIAERQNQSRYIRGTLLIAGDREQQQCFTDMWPQPVFQCFGANHHVPCRTAMRGSFPLNGTYFQVNEVFADHKSSHNPIHVERKQIWNLQRRMVFFGTSVPTIFKGLTTEEIQQCFWRGFVCVRGFDREFRAPRPLCPHLHVVARPKNHRTAATEQVQ